MPNSARLAVLVSGNGSNLQAIIDAIRDGSLDAHIAVVVSNRRDAYALARAREAGIPQLYFPLGRYCEMGRTRTHYDADLARYVASCAPDLVVLAGWMHVLGPAFLDCFPQGVLNLHPALPGQFAGTHAIERAYAAYQRGEITCTGAMVHWVIPEVDAGPVVAVAEVPIHRADGVADLEARIHDSEHRLLVDAIRLVIKKERTPWQGHVSPC